MRIISSRSFPFYQSKKKIKKKKIKENNTRKLTKQILIPLICLQFWPVSKYAVLSANFISIFNFFIFKNGHFTTVYAQTNISVLRIFSILLSLFRISYEAIGHQRIRTDFLADILNYNHLLSGALSLYWPWTVSTCFTATLLLYAAFHLHLFF